jgi:adenylate kinase
MRIVFIGPPGAGKGTQAAMLIGKYKLAHLSTGDMLRSARDAKTEVGLNADKYMSAGMLVPDNIIVDIIAERLKQSEALDAMLAKKGTPLDVVLELKVPEDELFKRLAGRGRADDTPDVIRQRLAAYRKQTEPLLAYYAKRGLLKSIDGLGTVEEIFGRAKTVLDQAG